MICVVTDVVGELAIVSIGSRSADGSVVVALHRHIAAGRCETRMAEMTVMIMRSIRRWMSIQVVVCVVDVVRGKVVL